MLITVSVKLPNLCLDFLAVNTSSPWVGSKSFVPESKVGGRKRLQGTRPSPGSTAL